ncbi:unnamed protein product [Gordionus sp. m RMFG-2023]
METQSQLISFKKLFVQITIIPKDMGMRFDTCNSLEGMTHLNNVTEIRKRRCLCNSDEHLIQRCPSGLTYHKKSKKNVNNNKNLQISLFLIFDVPGSSSLPLSIKFSHAFDLWEKGSHYILDP